ncbi:MAG: hypothetical protein HOP12_13225 [Candidatus Eisenbacteria bacterium]|uniref:MipA/OmpV family protein n=1 Tax=Eiseniibacteriota bacterium TaxID=2212470 RepID=A0A849SMS9_UNCEI|nr:hypothetical protein [Candidatus Eisenbacteria bacterium]
MNSNPLTPLALGVVLGCAVLPCRAGAEAEPDASDKSPVVEWSTTYASRYAFQGFDYSEGRPVLQPSTSVSLRGFTAGLWGNVNQTRQELDELDVTLERDFERGRLSGSLGYAYLDYPHREDWAPTHEAILDLAFAAPLAASLSMHWDAAAGAGRYWTFGLAREFESARGTFALTAKLFAQEHYYGMTGFPACETGAAFAGAWGAIAIEPAVARTWAWANGDFRDALAIEPHWMGSISVSSAWAR